MCSFKDVSAKIKNTRDRIRGLERKNVERKNNGKG